MLTGAYRSPSDLPSDDFRRFAPRFSEENFPKNLELVEKIEAVAKRKGGGVTVGQVALAWLMKQGEDVIPIPGTKKEKYLVENLGSLGVELTEGEEGEIREACERAEVAGGRYPEGMGGILFADTPDLK